MPESIERSLRNQVMLKFTKRAGVVSVILLILTTSCSSSKQSQDSSLGSKSSNATEVTASSPAKIALASHLKQTGAIFYGTYWCQYCTKQKQLFGQQAVDKLNYVECDPNGPNPQPDLCQKANINALPTWEIKGQQYPGVLSLQELAELSGYQGDRNFGN